MTDSSSPPPPPGPPAPARLGSSPSFLSGNRLWLLIVLLMLTGAILPVLMPCQEEGHPLEVVLLQVNDVYEIAGLDNGAIGGMARIATLKQQLLSANGNTLLVMAGDFISPSIFNSARQDDKEIAGRQMIDAMNAARFDLVIFGNHEFDFKYSILQQRIDESTFQWLASNVHHRMGTDSMPFQKKHADIPASWTRRFDDGKGHSATIGFIGLTIPDNQGDSNYAFYDSTLATAKRLYAQLAPTCDAVIAITHQDIKDDIILADSLPGLTAIMGGHEHDMQFKKVGEVYIAKAHANAKTAFKWKIVFDKKGKRPYVYPSLLSIDSSLPKDVLTAAIVDKWMDAGKEYFKNKGYHPDSPLCQGLNSSLDGRDESIRSRPTALTQLITNAMLWVTRPYHTQIALMNAGSIRVDDIITPPITEYSFLRALPYGGPVQVATFKGAFLKYLLDSAAKLTKDGAFLQYSDNLRKDPATRQWMVGKAPMADSTDYSVAIADYLVFNRQKKLKFIRENGRLIDSIPNGATGPDLRIDVVKATIAYYRQTCSGHP